MRQKGRSWVRAMFGKIILKNFKSNIKNYLLFFVSNILAVSELFVFWGIRDIVKESIADKVISAALNMDFAIAAGLITFITVFLMVFSMRYYIQLRIRDYTMFITLGMKKRVSYLLLLVEYSIGCVCSLVFGLLFGRGLLYVTQRVLHHLYPELVKMTSVDITVYRDTCGLCLGIMAGVFLILLVWMDQRDLSALMSSEQKNDKRPVSKKWLLVVLAGAGILVLGEYLYQGSDASYMYSHIVWVAGLFLVIAFGMALVLVRIQKSGRFYVRHIFQMNQLYSRYQNNLFILAILIAIHFFAMTYLTVEIASAFPLDQYRENYRYDAVWLTKQSHEEYGEELAREYEGELTEIPMVCVETFYGARQIGVSMSEYEKLTGEDYDLQGREILVGVEDSEYKKKQEVTREKERDTYKILYVGSEKGEEGSSLEIEKKEHGFQLKDMFTQSVLGQYSPDGYHENMIVFSDEYFAEQWEKAKAEEMQADTLALFTFPADRRKDAVSELKSYNREHEVGDANESVLESSLYITDEYLEGKKLRLMFSLCSKLFLMSALLLSALFVTGLKSLVELSEFTRRYDFLECMGMKQKIRRKNIRFETGILSKVVLGVMSCMAVVYLISMYYRMQLMGNASIDKVFLEAWLVVLAVYVAVNFLVQRIFAGYVVHRVEKENEHP